MNAPFVLDIETGPRPLEEIEPLLPVIEPPSNWKDETKRAAYVTEKREQLLAEAALSAVTGRVLAVGLLRDEGAPLFITDQSESELLHHTWRELERKRAGETFVTFNGTRFDWPFLFRRSVACGVPVPNWFPRNGRWPQTSHVDLFEQWQCGDRSESISLDRLARLLGLPGKTASGAEFARLWSTDIAAALDYLEHDLMLTRQIFERTHLRELTKVPL